jgi:hypothetical protein
MLDHMLVAPAVSAGEHPIGQPHSHLPSSHNALANLQCPLCQPGASDTTAAASSAAAAARPALRYAKLRFDSSARSSGTSAAATGGAVVC